MSPTPARDVEEERHFVAWLTERDPELAAEAAPLLDRLATLGGLDREGSAFADTLTEAGLGDVESDRLLQVHSAWTAFRREGRSREDAIAWVGAERDPDSEPSVQWVESSVAAEDAPSGPAPSLLSAGQRPRKPRPRRKKGWLRLSDLLVPAALVLSLVAVFVPAFLERGRVQALRSQAARDVADAGRPGSARWARVEHQANLASWLIDLRGRQLDHVRSTCEGGPWCKQRVAELELSLALAEELLADARAQPGVPVVEAFDWQPPSSVLDSLASELDGLSAKLDQWPEDARSEAAAILAWERAQLSLRRTR